MGGEEAYAIFSCPPTVRRMSQRLHDDQEIFIAILDYPFFVNKRIWWHQKISGYPPYLLPKQRTRAWWTYEASYGPVPKMWCQHKRSKRCESCKGWILLYLLLRLLSPYTTRMIPASVVIACSFVECATPKIRADCKKHKMRDLLFSYICRTPSSRLLGLPALLDVDWFLFGFMEHLWHATPTDRFNLSRDFWRSILNFYRHEDTDT